MVEEGRTNFCKFSSDHTHSMFFCIGVYERVRVCSVAHMPQLKSGGQRKLPSESLKSKVVRLGISCFLPHKPSQKKNNLKNFRLESLKVKLYNL